MKTFYFALFLLFTISITQAQWTNQNPVPNGNHLYSNFFIDDNIGWVVGSGGFIKKTTNAGLDWIQQSSGTTLTLKSVQFINQNIGWICGESGLIIKTTDSGQNWFGLTSGSTAELYDLQFCDENIGYAVGYNGTILKTTNGGTSWVSQSSGTTDNLFAVDFVDVLLGYAVGEDKRFLKTTDGGLNWIGKTLDIGIYVASLNCVEFIDANIGWIGSGSGSGGVWRFTISKTTDGGETWTTDTFYKAFFEENTIINEHIIENLADTQVGICSIYFKDANNGYAVGGTYSGWNRCIYSTTNAGITWQRKYNYLEQTCLLSVFVTNSGKGWAVGHYGVIYKTENNGISWSQILSGTITRYSGDLITSVFMINANIGWATGSRKGTNPYLIILKTTNGGKNWETNFEFNVNADPYNHKIYFLNENTGWVSNYNRQLYKTTDGGVNWVSNSAAVDEIFFINQDIGWKAKVNPNPTGISKTTDGGMSWVQKSSVSSRSIYFSDINNGWAVGAGGIILKSTDIGESWISKTSGTALDLNSVRFYDSNAGICVGNSGTVLLSTDGGENWGPKTVGTTATLNSIAITNMTTSWIAGSEGTMLNTTDLGNSWISYSGLEGNLTSLNFPNENMGWVCADNNIYKYSTEPLLSLNSPNGGEIWKTGLTRNIIWSSENVQYINLYYSTNSGTSWNTIASNVVAANGSYAWEIPLLGPFISPHCKVKIESASNSGFVDESNNTFIIWNTCNIIQYANLGQHVIDFLETNINISLTVVTSDNISVTYYPYEAPVDGTPPAGIDFVSEYYWQVSSAGISFNSGKTIVPISTLRGVTDASNIVWLKRTNPGDPWENIGGLVVGDNLESTVLFNSFSEFAIGSSDNPLPVELSSFTAITKPHQILLEWETKTETNNFGFEIERKLSDRWQKIGFIVGSGNSNSPKEYSYSDKNPTGGSKFHYRLKQIDNNGQFEYSKVVEVEIIPNEYALYQNYPNPFNPSTKIRYQLPNDSKVVIKIYNILGSEVLELLNEQKEAGVYETEFNSYNLSSGTYIYKISADNFVQTKKMVLLK